MHQIIAKKVTLDRTHVNKINRALTRLFTEDVQDEEEKTTRMKTNQYELSAAQVNIIHQHGHGVVAVTKCNIKKRQVKVDDDTGRDIIYTSEIGERKGSKRVSSVIYLREKGSFGKISSFIDVVKVDNGTSHIETWAFVYEYANCRFDQGSQCFLADDDFKVIPLLVPVETMEDPLIFAITGDDIWFINAVYERTFLDEQDL